MVTEANNIFGGSWLYQNMALTYKYIHVNNFCSILANHKLFKTIRKEWELFNLDNSLKTKLKLEAD